MCCASTIFSPWWDSEAFTHYPSFSLHFDFLHQSFSCMSVSHRAGPAPCGERSFWNVVAWRVTTGTKMNRFEKLMRIANISVSLSLALPMWAWDIKPPVILHENIYLENKTPQETQPIYRSWIRSPQTDTTMQISRSSSIRHRISSCFAFPPPRQHLTLGSEEFHSLAELKMWFTVVTVHTNAVIPRLRHCKPRSLAAFAPWYKIYVCWLLSDTSHKNMKHKR